MNRYNKNNWSYIFLGQNLHDNNNNNNIIVNNNNNNFDIFI